MTGFARAFSKEIDAPIAIIEEEMSRGGKVDSTLLLQKSTAAGCRSFKQRYTEFGSPTVASDQLMGRSWVE